VHVLGYPEIDNPSLVTVGRGLGGLPELGIQADEATDGAGLLREALATLPGDQLVVAGVAPGNARALRTFLRVGFEPVASVQVYCRAG
jgi:RimJ/RimL family protein N-acetyltransferase